jgi:hypothetical protein
VIALVRLQVLGELVDPLGEQGGLDLTRSGVALSTLEVAHQLGFARRTDQSCSPRKARIV